MNVDRDNTGPENNGGQLSPKQYALLSGFFIFLITILIFITPFIPNISGATSATHKFFLYLLMGLACAVLLFGAMYSYGRVRGQRLGISFEFGGPAALAVLILLAGLYYDSNVKPSSSTATEQQLLLIKVRILIEPPSTPHVSRFQHGPADCLHNAVETLTVMSFDLGDTGFSCSYSVNKHNTGVCRGTPFSEQRPIFYGQVTGDYRISNNQIRISNLEDNYPSDLEQDTKAGRFLVQYFRSKDGAHIPQ